MPDKKRGLYQKYEVSKISNRGKDIDCIVLEFDDPISRHGIKLWAKEMYRHGYKECAAEVYKKLATYEIDGKLDYLLE